MAGMIGQGLWDAPQKNVFCGEKKYLKLYKHRVRERMFPVMEDDSYFLMVKSGKGRAVINGLSFSLEPGDVCWIQCTQVITIEAADAEELELWSIVFDYVLSNYLMLGSGGQSHRESVVAGLPVIKGGSAVAQSICRLFRRFDRMNAYRDHGSALIKVSILGQISLLFSSYECSPEERQSLERGGLGWWASIYIAMHSLEDISAESAARELGAEVSALNRQLRSVTGLGFEQMLCRSRCILAASYFLCENLPLDYIAIRSGFKTQVTFFRCFKKTMGMTAGEYRDARMCDGKNGKVYRGPIMDDRLMAVIRYLYTNISEQISLSHMAEETFISPSIIRSLIDKAFGVGYKDILSLFRIRYSEALLSSTELYLLDIAVIVGFNTVSTFSRKFKEVNGITPSEYREQCQNGGDGND